MIFRSLCDLSWQFRDAAGGAWRKAVVPGCVHRDLLREGELIDPFWARNEHQVQWVGEKEWEYRTSFEVGADLATHEHLDLVADGLDTLVTLFVNGRKIGGGENMFTGYRFPVKKFLRAGRNELRLRFASATRYVRRVRQEHRPRDANDPVGGCTRIRKQQCQFGWDWAPRLVTAGIWRDLRLEGWTENRLVDVRVTQTHHKDGSVTLDFTPEFARRDSRLSLTGTVSLEGKVVAQIQGPKTKIPDPKLWWPHGQGSQPLYEIELRAERDGRRIGEWRRRIGLRTVELSRRLDRWGESFTFLVNGRPVFMKGASWIPAHSFVAGLTREDYARDLRSAAQANMNMVRVWGGGVYESEDFYDLCDELGLLVWQDFMFSCTLYPGDAAFQALVRDEAEHQVRRLRHRACLALWCGNNELEILNEIPLKEPALRRNYDALFRRILPEAVSAFDGATPYWRSSPCQSDKPGLNDPEKSGNAHFWDVWHARHPVQRYEEKFYRFISEFGMQSFPSERLARTFCPSGQLNIFAPAMENHQRNPGGNLTLLDYISRRYRLPKDYASLAYVSQLNQAHCMQVGVEHYRRNRPRTMGALYWQLNDCWPVASWSSLEFDGQWKPLHHAARRFFAPLLLSAQLEGRETVGTGNWTHSTISGVTLHTVSDLPTDTAVKLHWQLCLLDGETVKSGRRALRLRAGEAKAQLKLDFGREFQRHGRDRLYFRSWLEHAVHGTQPDTVFFTAPRSIDFPAGKIASRIKAVTSREFAVTLRSPVLQHRVWLECEKLKFRASDNAFDLYPGEPRTITLTFDQEVNASRVAAELRITSLVDTYV